MITVSLAQVFYDTVNLHLENQAVRLKKEVKMKIIDAKSLGKAIRDRRKELNYTQTYLSEFTGFSVSFISDLERGKPTVELEKTLEIINILGLDILIEKRG